MGKLGRKVYCNFDKKVKCILLIKGYKRCVFEETTKEQNVKGERQVGICALLPQSERESLVEAMKKKVCPILEVGKINATVLQKSNSPLMNFRVISLLGVSKKVSAFATSTTSPL